MPNMEELLRLRWTLFRNVLTTIKTVRTGHLGACCSSLDLMTVLYFGDILRFDWENSRHPLRDYVLNRGHLGPLKYNIFHLLGWMSSDEMSQYRQYGSRLAGHEDMDLTPGVDITPSGSLGMVLSYAVGARIGMRDLHMPNRVFCFLGDGEEQEGNVSEAARHAGHLNISRLICVIDRNGGQLSTRTRNTDNGVDLSALWTAYGWRVIDLNNGHDLSAIYEAYQEAIDAAEDGPVCIIANTEKGHGVPGCAEDYCGFHVFHGSEVQDVGETVRAIDIKGALAEIPLEYLQKPLVIPRQKLPPYSGTSFHVPGPINLSPTGGKLQAYDVEYNFIAALENRIGERLYLITSDYPLRNLMYGTGGNLPLTRCHYYNVGLREQHMTALIHGLAQIRKDAVFVVLCGDAFLYRHMDQINVLAQAGTRVLFYSVQGGLSGARNGSTHQSSGQPGALLMMPGVVCEEPCSAEDIIDASNRALDYKGPTYIRLQKLPIKWSLGGKRQKGFEVLKYFPDAQGTIIGSGMTTIEALKACEAMEMSEIHHNLISICSLSDCPGVAKWVKPNAPLYLLYNGKPEILAAALYGQICTMPVPPSRLVLQGFDVGVSGSIPELLRHFHLDAESIVRMCALG